MIGELRFFLDCEFRIRDFYFRTFSNNSLFICVLPVICFVLFICICIFYFFIFGLVLVICWFIIIAKSVSFNPFLL